MSKTTDEPEVVDLSAWINEASNDQIKHNQREITAIILNAVSLIDALRKNLVLKGGILLAIAHRSQRQTTDIDFTARGDPDTFVEQFLLNMNRGLDRARAKLGYAQWRCRVQGKIKLQPKLFATAHAPALGARIGYARAGSPDEKHLANDQCKNVIDVEVSFREPLIETEEVMLIAGNAALEVYSVNEVVAEKFRAFLQQGVRNRRRRQDIYDIAYLIGEHDISAFDLPLILAALRKKCRAREVPLDPERIDDMDLIARARSEWHTMELELGDLPSFDECHAIARTLFLALPWND